jgi:PAS domain S-box-containing protein
MTLQQKTILGIGLLFGSFAAGIVVVSEALLSKSYKELEHDEARLQVRYLSEGFNRFGQELATFSHPFATWKPTTTFLSNPASLPEYPKRLDAHVLAQQNVNLLILADVDGNIRLKSYYDPVMGDGKTLPDEAFTDILASIRKLPSSGSRSNRGLTALKIANDSLILCVESEPVMNPDTPGVPTGILVLGRKLEDADIRGIHTLEQANLDYTLASAPNLSSDWKEANNAFNRGEDSYIKEKSDSTLCVYSTQRNLDGKPLLDIKVESPRVFYQRGQDTLRLFMILTVSFGVLAIILSYGFLERYLIWRIRLLGNQLAAIRRKKNPTLRLTVTGRDELGTLTEDINQTLTALDEEESQREMAQREHKIIIDSLKEVIFRIDKEGKWTYLNPAWKELTGFSEKETLEKYFASSIYKDDSIQAQDLVNNILESRTESGSVEVRYHTKSGAIRWVQLFARSTRDGTGKVNGLTGTLFDVTERINAEKKLRENEKLYRLVSENSTDVIFRLTLQGDILYTSRASISILGYTPEELKNTWIYDYCHPEDSIRVQKAYQKILERGGTSTVEHQIRRKNGQYLWVESVGKPITDENGKPIVDEAGRTMELIITTRDITERKNNEKVLLLREKALSSASCGVLIADASKPEFPTTYANTSFERMTGYGSEEWMGKPAHFIAGEKTDSNALDKIKTAFATATETDQTFLCYRKDGSTFWNHMAITPLYDKTGILTHFISVLTDVSDIKSIQDELQKAKDMAESASKAKSEFLATMSHEIRTPMNAVIGFTDLMGGTPLNEQQKEFLSNINLSANSLLTIISDILDFSKIEAGKLDLDPQPTVLSQIIEESITTVKPKTDSKGLKLSYDIDPAVPSIVIVDGPRLGQVFRNLLSNAAKFTQRGHITISVKSQSIDSTHERLFFEVADSGIGIPHDKVGKLFQSFTQVDSSTTRKYGGTGLGLAICKKFCEMMDGSILVESVYGKGSTFKFNIKVGIDQEFLSPPQQVVVKSPPLPEGSPFSPVPQATTKGKTASPISAKGKTASPIKTKSPFVAPAARTDDQPYRIMIVEDNPANQLVLLKMLAQMNLAADMANHGKEAMELWLRQPYHIILTDLQMPEMDGIELTKALREREKGMGNGHPTYIVGVTANVLPEYREKCLQAGMDDFLVKPLRIDTLKKALMKYQSKLQV